MALKAQPPAWSIALSEEDPSSMVQSGRNLSRI